MSAQQRPGVVTLTRRPPCARCARAEEFRALAEREIDYLGLMVQVRDAEITRLRRLVPPVAPTWIETTAATAVCLVARLWARLIGGR